MTKMTGTDRLSKWLSKGPDDKVKKIHAAAIKFSEALSKLDFTWVATDPDGAACDRSTICFQREATGGLFDHIAIDFASDWALCFWVRFGVFEQGSAGKALIRGDLKNRRLLDLEPTRWGARTWTLNKSAKFEKQVDNVTHMFSQVNDYLKGEGIGPNILP